VERMHSCSASFSDAEAVAETFEGETVWEGSVSVFRVDHPDTDTYYAWSSPIEGSENRQFYAVLKVPLIESAADAVRAAIVSDYRKGQK
jgi:hypothetical protein